MKKILLFIIIGLVIQSCGDNSKNSKNQIDDNDISKIQLNQEDRFKETFLKSIEDCKADYRNWPESAKLNQAVQNHCFLNKTLITQIQTLKVDSSNAKIFQDSTGNIYNLNLNLEYEIRIDTIQIFSKTFNLVEDLGFDDTCSLNDNSYLYMKLLFINPHYNSLIFEIVPLGKYIVVEFDGNIKHYGEFYNQNYIQANLAFDNALITMDFEVLITASEIYYFATKRNFLFESDSISNLLNLPEDREKFKLEYFSFLKDRNILLIYANREDTTFDNFIVVNENFEIIKNTDYLHPNSVCMSNLREAGYEIYNKNKFVFLGWENRKGSNNPIHGEFIIVINKQSPYEIEKYYGSQLEIYTSDFQYNEKVENHFNHWDPYFFYFDTINHKITYEQIHYEGD